MNPDNKLTRRHLIGASLLGLSAIPVVTETALAQAKPAAAPAAKPAAGALPVRIAGRRSELRSL